jgi:D-alanyl-D-alanine carboxypeptidase (penicillin-binding protein 5/6)
VAPATLLAILLTSLGATAATPKPETPPPTPVPPLASPSPFVSVLHTPPPGEAEPIVSAPGAALADLDTGQLLWTKEPKAQRPIASVTKIMTAVLVLERADPEDVVTVSDRAASGGPTAGISNLGLLPGERVRVEDLLYALMLQSANDAALALAEHVSGSVEAFVKLMNRKAVRLGLRQTEFLSPGGLDDRGHSSPADLVRLTRAAYAEPGFERLSSTRFHEVPAPEGRPRVVQNRNVLLWLYPGSIGVKTGFTSAAGFCVVAAAERDGVRLVAVVLGSAGEAFSDAAEMLSYGFAAFERHAFVRRGESLGRLEIVGGRVPVAAGARLEALVRSDEIEIATRETKADPGALFPPSEGERVGFLTVRARDAVLGRVPLVAARVPGPEPAAGSWLGRAASTVWDAVTGAFAALLG